MKKRIVIGLSCLALLASVMVVRVCTSTDDHAHVSDRHDDSSSPTLHHGGSVDAQDQTVVADLAPIQWSDSGIVPVTPEARAALLHSTLAQSYHLGSLGGDARPRRCIAILGQSNAAGRKFIEQVTTDHDLLNTPFSNVPISEWESGHTSPFSVLYDTLHQTGSQSPISPNNRALSPRPYTLVPNAVPNMGTELSLGHAIDSIAPNQFGLIKCSIGGTTLATEWCPLCTYPTTGPPNLYTTCVQYVQDAAASMGCKVSAIWWLQGESDSIDNTQAAAYQSNLTTLVTAFRTTFHNVPFILHRLPSNLSVGNPSGLATLRAAQVAFVNATEKTAWVNSDGLTLDSGLHFTPDSYVTLGYRAVPAIINAMGYARPPTANFSVFAPDRTAQFTDLSVDPNVGSNANPAVGGTVTSWAWDFGDGGTSTSQSPSHTYTGDGSYNVKLVVKNSAGVPAAITQTITVALPTWTTDATSNVGFPSTSVEWTDFETKHSLTAYGTPSDLYTFQNSSGAVTDAIGGKNLAIGNVPTYSKTITGWSRKAIGGSGASTTQSASNTTLVNLNTSSWMIVAYVRFDQSTSVNRQMICGGGSGVNCLQAPGGLAGMQKRTGSNLKSSTLAHSGSTVHPYIILYDRTNQRDCIFSDIEKICVTWSSQSGTTLTISFSLSSDPANVADVLGLTVFRGSAAERSDAEICHLERALGWNPSGFACN